MWLSLATGYDKHMLFHGSMMVACLARDSDAMKKQTGTGAVIIQLPTGKLLVRVSDCCCIRIHKNIGCS